MNRFYLCQTKDRKIISQKAEGTVLRICYAKGWIEAKAKFAVIYPEIRLTREQSIKLGKDHDDDYLY